jgi:hypothetical protein
MVVRSIPALAGLKTRNYELTILLSRAPVEVCYTDPSG